MSLIAQFLIGLLFGSGLVVAGMSNPQKVLNFLDIASMSSGGWDPSLAFVMGGGVLVTWLGYGLVFKHSQPVFDSQFHLPRAKALNMPLVAGAAVFGVGWGMSGFCPGPAFTALTTGTSEAYAFVAAMLAGMVAARLLALKQIAAQPMPVKS